MGSEMCIRDSNTHFDNIEAGLGAVGFSEADVAAVMGGNWYRFFAENFGPAQ